MGTLLTTKLGVAVGESVGSTVGDFVIGSAGDSVGKCEGTLLGSIVGDSEGNESLGSLDGADDNELGRTEGVLDNGNPVGIAVGSLEPLLG